MNTYIYIHILCIIYGTYIHSYTKTNKWICWDLVSLEMSRELTLHESLVGNLPLQEFLVVFDTGSGNLFLPDRRQGWPSHDRGCCTFLNTFPKRNRDVSWILLKSESGWEDDCPNSTISFCGMICSFPGMIRLDKEVYIWHDQTKKD